MLRDFNYFVIRAGNLIYSYKDIFDKCFRLNGTSAHYRYTKEDRSCCLCLANLLSYRSEMDKSSQFLT